MNIVKVRYNTDPADVVSREYSYYSEDEMNVGDLVEVPIRYGRAKARVTAIGVPEADIAAFKDAVRTIPAGSRIVAGTGVVAVVDVVRDLAEPQPTTEETSTIAIINVAPGKDSAVLALQDQVLGLLTYAQTRFILSDDDVKLATDDLTLMSGLKRAIEAKRKEYVDPINTHLKEINEKFRLLTDPLAQADGMTREKVLAYRMEVQRLRKEAEEINRLRLEAAQREAAMHQGEISEEVKVLEVPTAPPAHVRTDVGTLGTSTVWKFEVTDFALLPADYKMVDASKLGKVVRAGLHTIAGVRIWEEETLRVTGR
jgi:hypothetical protein